MPPGATAVVPVEATELADEHVIVHQERVDPGENIRPVGVDLAKGSAVGAGKSPRRRRDGPPGRFGCRSGTGGKATPGERLVDGERAGRAGRNSRTRTDPRRKPFQPHRRAARSGADVVWAGRARTKRPPCGIAVGRIAESDVVLTSGGVSMGDLDLVKPLLAELAEVHFRRVFMKPGKPFNFATSGDTLIFSLPGNPVSALVGFEVFIRPALRRCSGRRRSTVLVLRVRLDHSVRPSDRIEFQRAIVASTPKDI